MKLNYDSEVLRRFCRPRGIAKLELFGSAAGAEFRPESGVDLFCTLTAKKDMECGLLEWLDMRFGLEEISGRPVDLVRRRAIERSRNPYRKTAILADARPLYAEG